MSLKEKKSICFVIPYWVTELTGGAELQCYLLSEELIERGWEVEVFSKVNNNQKVRFENYFNPKVKYYTYRDYKSKLWTFIVAFFKFFNTRSHYYYNRTNSKIIRGASILYSWFTGKKVVYALAGDDELVYTRYSDEYKNRLSKPGGMLHYIDAYLADLLVRKSPSKVDLILSQTYFQQSELKKNTNLDSVILRNSYSYKEKELPQKENIILWVGNSRPTKRPELFLKLADEFHEESWKLIMIGKIENYENKIKKVKNPNFIALGQLSYEDTIAWFKKAKIIVSTSEVEGFSNTFIQAWFYKVYVLSLSADPDGLLQNNNLGYCAQNDYKDFKQHLIKWCNNGMGTECLDRAFGFASNEFKLQENVDKFVQLLSKLNEE